MKTPAVVAYGTRFLRCMCLAQPFMCLDFLAVGVFQACGLGRYSLIFAVLPAGFPPPRKEQHEEIQAGGAVGQKGGAPRPRRPNSAVTLAAPVLLAFNAVNNLFGVGSSSMMSRALGAGDLDTVRRSSAFGFYRAARRNTGRRRSWTERWRTPPPPPPCPVPRAG